MNQTQQDLQAARALIAKGWCQGGPVKEVNGAECVCSLRAIQVSTPDFARNHAAYTALCQAISMPTVVGWNDAPERTKDEVLAAFDGAIALAGS